MPEAGAPALDLLTLPYWQWDWRQPAPRGRRQAHPTRCRRSNFVCLPCVKGNRMLVLAQRKSALLMKHFRTHEARKEQST